MFFPERAVACEFGFACLPGARTKRRVMVDDCMLKARSLGFGCAHGCHTIKAPTAPQGEENLQPRGV